MAETKPVLGYWAIRGLAQPIRMALAYGKVDFEDTMYQQGDASTNYSKACWYDVKKTLGINIPNLPYILDGEMKISQSVACLTYACDLAGIHDGFTIKQKAEALSLAEGVMDIRNPAVGLFYGTYDQEGAKAQYVEKAKGRFMKFSALLGEKDWLLGSKLCSADFHLAEMVYQHLILDDSMFAGMENLVKYCQRFFQLPAIAAVEAQSVKAQIPMNNMQAKFGGSFLESKIPA